MSGTQIALADDVDRKIVAPITGMTLPALRMVVPLEQPPSPGNDQLRVLARALGRQAARRHLARGRSVLEIAISVAVGALIIAAALYADLIHLGSR